jgi:hypothetical protein
MYFKIENHIRGEGVQPFKAERFAPSALTVGKAALCIDDIPMILSVNRDCFLKQH